jgi:hypothetical protein
MTGERRVDDGEELNADAKELDGRRRDAAAWLAAAPSPAASSRAARWPCHKAARVARCSPEVYLAAPDLGF